MTALSCSPAVRNLCTDPAPLPLYNNRLWQSCYIFLSEHRSSPCLHTHSGGCWCPLPSFPTRGYSRAPRLLLPRLLAPCNATGEGRNQLCLFFVITFIYFFPDVSGDHFPLSALDYSKFNKINSDLLAPECFCYTTAFSSKITPFFSGNLLSVNAH